MPNWYVDPDQADDFGAGESWATAKKHLNAMIQALTYPLAGMPVTQLGIDLWADISTGSDGERYSDWALTLVK